MTNCTDCILDGTDACPKGAGRAVDDNVCEYFIDDKETEVDFSRMFEESEGEDDNS